MIPRATYLLEFSYRLDDAGTRLVAGASLGGERISAYHVEAAIASLHAAAPSYRMPV